jgi:hypothetical protein
VAPTTSSSSLIDLVTIDVPCTVSWDGMAGDDRVRFCSQCQLQVFDISKMSRDEAEELIVSRAGQRLCGRIHRRPDGTAMTRDCFSVRRAAGRSVARLVTLAAGCFLAVIGGVAMAIGSSGRNAAVPQTRLRHIEPFRTVLNWLDPPEMVVMGDVITPTVATELWSSDDEPSSENEVERASVPTENGE